MQPQPEHGHSHSHSHTEVLQNPGMVVEGAWQLIPAGVSNVISHGRIIPFSPLQINDSHQSLHDCRKKRSGSSRKGSC